jgi:pre-mRNA-splicing factor 38A
LEDDFEEEEEKEENEGIADGSEDEMVSAFILQ